MLPYCQALTRFVAHIQQLDMESNGKRLQMEGSGCPTSTGSVYFGEPGINGQHSFYQLLHKGRTVPADFIGFRDSQNPIFMEGEVVSNHNDFMSNYFAQPDAGVPPASAGGCPSADPSSSLQRDAPPAVHGMGDLL